jgi:hypothetical protein
LKFHKRSIFGGQKYKIWWDADLAPPISVLGVTLFYYRLILYSTPMPAMNKRKKCKRKAHILVSIVAQVAESSQPSSKKIIELHKRKRLPLSNYFCSNIFYIFAHFYRKL